jgi:hypothetical protein
LRAFESRQNIFFFSSLFFYEERLQWFEAFVARALFLKFRGKRDPVKRIAPSLAVFEREPSRWGEEGLLCKALKRAFKFFLGGLWLFFIFWSVYADYSLRARFAKCLFLRSPFPFLWEVWAPQGALALFRKGVKEF